MRTEDFLLKAFNNMSVNFSSNEFTKELRKIGCPERIIWKQSHLTFLHINCVQDGTKRTWIKKESNADLFTYTEKPIKTRKKRQPKKESNESTKKVGLIRTVLRWIY
jgi:hypothetical protein